MPSFFFKIGNTDLTAYEDIQNHDVQREDIYTSWTDGNWVDHREIVRTRVTGTVKLGFRKAADFAAFQTLLGTAQDPEGYYPVSVYCANTGTTETVDAFLEITGADKWNLTSSRQWQVVTIKITGR